MRRRRQNNGNAGGGNSSNTSSAGEISTSSSSSSSSSITNPGPGPGSSPCSDAISPQINQHAQLIASYCSSSSSSNGGSIHYLQDSSVVLHYPSSQSQGQDQGQDKEQEQGQDQDKGRDEVPGLADKGHAPPSSDTPPPPPRPPPPPPLPLHAISIYGAPWQPAFWGGFNLPRHSEQLREKWRMIPSHVDILLTHSPPHGILGRSPPPLFSLQLFSRVVCSLLLILTPVVFSLL